MSVCINEYITYTDETVILSSQFINVVSWKSDVLDFINERPGKIFKHLRVHRLFLLSCEVSSNIGTYIVCNFVNLLVFIKYLPRLQ